MAYAAADTSRFYIDGTGLIDFYEKFKYLGSMLHYSLTSDADVDKRITSATAAFGALKNIFADKYLSEELKGEVYKALILPTLLYGCEACSHVIHPSLARKRTGDAEIGWRPTPEKNVETMPCWGKKIAQRIASWT
jgi:hypothetical protein